MENNTVTSETDIKEQLKICIEAIDDKKGEDIVILKMPEDASIASYFVIATGKSDAQLRAMKNSIDDALNLKHGKINHSNTGWHVLDLFDIVIHLFSEEKRDFYRLDALWKDATIITVDNL
jgi:ribosome-associated protein